MSLEGCRLGEFEIIESLGEGGMGAVYKARQISLGRNVALKALQSSLAKDSEFIARFRREAMAAASLSHPNLVQVYSAGESDGVHWFAMEFIEGESAQARLKRKGALKPREAIAITLYVAAALEHGWRKAELIHRDVKPDNIFLSVDGHVKLGDLGLAKSVGQKDSLTMTGAVMGTPHYMSPEQVTGKKDVDLRTDIYSLGCTLFHLLGGQPPYAGNSAVAIIFLQVSAPIPDLRSVWPECPAPLGEVVGKMMQKDPADRHQSYSEVIADLNLACDALNGASEPPDDDAPPPELDTPPTPEPEKESVPVIARIGRVPGMIWIGAGAAVLVAAGALFLFAPRKKAAPANAATSRERVPPAGVSTPPRANSPVPKPTIATAPRPAKIKPARIVALPARTAPPSTPTPTPTPTVAPPTPAPPVRTPTPLPGIQPVDTSTMKQIVDADFSRNLSGFIKLETSSWHIGRSNNNAGYQMVLKDAGVWWPSEPVLHKLHLKDFVCEVWARIAHAEDDGGWGIGFIGGVPSGQPWSGVMTNGKGQLSSFPAPQGGDFPYISTPAMLPGRINALRVEAFGARTRVFVNGSFVFERFHERQKPDCGLSIYLFGGRPPEDVRFKSVKVWTPQ